MATVKTDLLNALKIAGEAILQVGEGELGPIEAAGLQALNTLLQNLLTKAATAKAVAAITPVAGS
jgi:hypothetical protein